MCFSWWQILGTLPLPPDVPELKHCCIEMVSILSLLCNESRVRVHFVHCWYRGAWYTFYKRCSDTSSWVTPLGWFLEYTSSTSRYKETSVHRYFVQFPLGTWAWHFHFTKFNSHLGLANVEVKGEKLAFILDFKNKMCVYREAAEMLSWQKLTSSVRAEFWGKRLCESWHSRACDRPGQGIPGAC